jgi:hypothetical protein
MDILLLVGAIVLSFALFLLAVAVVQMAINYLKREKVMSKSSISFYDALVVYVLFMILVKSVTYCPNP